MRSRCCARGRPRSSGAPPSCTSRARASGETIAAHRARRYQPYAPVADLCCGAGGDTLALAGVAPVVAVDRDPLRLAMAAANARAYGLAERVAFVEADLEQAPPPDCAA